MCELIHLVDATDLKCFPLSKNATYQHRKNVHLDPTENPLTDKVDHPHIWGKHGDDNATRLDFQQVHYFAALKSHHIHIYFSLQML